MKASLYFLLIILSHSLLAQNTYYKLYSNELENTLEDIEIHNNHIYISALGLARNDTNFYSLITNLSKLKLEKGIAIKTEQKSQLLPYYYDKNSFNRLSKYDNNFIVSGHEAGKVQETKFHIFDTDLIDQEEFSITSVNAEIIGNEGIYVEDSILYSYGLLQKEEVLYANIIKYNLNTNAIIWDKNYKKGKRLNQIWDFQKTHDGNFIFIIFHKDADAGAGSNSGYQIIKINPEGDILDSFSHKNLGADKQRILVTNEGAIYYTTEDNPLSPIIPTDGRINKLSSDMDTILWSLELPSNAFTNGNRYEIFDYFQATNGDIMACGKVWHMPGGPLVAGLNASWNGFLARVSQDGKLKWLRIYRLPNDNPKLPKTNYGDFRFGQLDKIIQKEDGNFVLGGTASYTPTQLDGLQFGDTISSLWVMVVDESGCLKGEECEEVIHLDSNKKPSAPALLVYDNVTWTETSSDFTGIKSSSKYGFSKDTFVINEKTYRQQTYALSKDLPTDQLTGIYFREENNKIYMLGYDSTDILFYDFNLLPNDTFTTYDQSNQNYIKYIVTDTSSVELIDNAIRKTINLRCANDPNGGNFGHIKWIEGVGSLQGFNSPPWTCYTDWLTLLNCHYRNDTLLYINPEANDCWTVATDDVIPLNFKILPNPTYGKINIVCDFDIDKVKVYNNIGQKVLEYSKLKNIDLSGLPNGQYIVELSISNKITGRQTLIKMN
ncbi:MAG: hypothetical protein RLZZ546_2233 [Bacteroidota bacterium]|jgi:hypothetical protein